LSVGVKARMRNRGAGYFTVMVIGCDKFVMAFDRCSIKDYLLTYLIIVVVSSTLVIVCYSY